MTLKIESNKIILSNDAILALESNPGDRIIIGYTLEMEEPSPVIYKSDSDSGNKLTKKNTVSFRGSQNATLLEFGDFFELKKIEGSKTFKLIIKK